MRRYSISHLDGPCNPGTSATIGSTPETRRRQRVGPRMSRLRCFPFMVGVMLITFGMQAALAIELVATIPLSGVKGRIDHLAADPIGHGLFVAALGNDSVEVIDTRSSATQSCRSRIQRAAVAYVRCGTSCGSTIGRKTF